MRTAAENGFMSDEASKYCIQASIHSVHNFIINYFEGDVINIVNAWTNYLFANYPYYKWLGRNQVAVGLVPINFANKSSESALSVYPVAIANCKEKR